MCPVWFPVTPNSVNLFSVALLKRCPGVSPTQMRHPHARTHTHPHTHIILFNHGSVNKCKQGGAHTPRSVPGDHAMSLMWRLIRAPRIHKCLLFEMQMTPQSSKRPLALSHTHTHTPESSQTLERMCCYIYIYIYRM